MPAFIKRVFAPEKRWSWLALALLLKFGGVAFFIAYNHDTAGSRHIALEHGDTFSYLNPIDTLIATGEYRPDLRMPGYGVVYWSFRQATTIPYARDLMVLAHLLLATLAVYLGARMAQHLSGSTTAFVVIFFVLAVSPYMSTLESRLCTESFCSSALIFSLWSLIRWQRSNASGWLLFSGAMMAWAVFLRPACALILVIVAVALFFRQQRSWRSRVIATAVFLLPFTIVDGIWTARNWRVHHAFHPLTNGLFYTHPRSELHRAALALVQLYGGHMMYWDGRSHLSWFNARDVLVPPVKDPQGPPPPDWFQTPDFNKDSLVMLARLTDEALRLDLDSATRTPLIHAAIERYERYAASASEHLPFHTRVISRLVSTWNFYWQYGSAGLFYNPWERSSLPAKVMKVVQGFLYLLVVFLGTAIGLARMIRPSGDLVARVIPWIAVTSMLVIPLAFRLTEYRYSVPYFALLAMLVFDQAQRWWRRRQSA